MRAVRGAHGTHTSTSHDIRTITPTYRNVSLKKVVKLWDGFSR